MLKIAIAYVSAAALSSMGTLGFAEEASPLHQGDWPIHNWHDQQPSQDQLNALGQPDVTANQAQEVDRLYDQLLANSPHTDSRADDDINEENKLLDKELKGICRGC